MRVRALTITLNFRPPMVTDVAAAVEAAPVMLCCFPAAARPVRVSLSLLPCLDAIPDAVASLGLTLRPWTA